MTQERSPVICDGCGQDISYRTNEVDYRLRLASETKPLHSPGFVTAMNIEPDIGANKHFCDLKCLRAWVEKGFPGR